MDTYKDSIRVLRPQKKDSNSLSVLKINALRENINEVDFVYYRRSYNLVLPPL